MTGSLPWGWLNSTAPVMPGTEHQHDDVTLRPDERLRLGSIVAGWNDEVACNIGAQIASTQTCSAPAQWVYRCAACGNAWMYCTPHRVEDDRLFSYSEDQCARCDEAGVSTTLPSPLPWLPL